MISMVIKTALADSRCNCIHYQSPGMTADRWGIRYSDRSFYSKVEGHVLARSKRVKHCNKEIDLRASSVYPRMIDTIWGCTLDRFSFGFAYEGRTARTGAHTSARIWREGMETGWMRLLEKRASPVVVAASLLLLQPTSIFEVELGIRDRRHS